MMTRGSLQGAAKALRAAPAFNRPATELSRWIVQRTGIRAEWLIRHLPRAGTVKVRLPNGRTLRLWSRGDDWISTQVFWRGWPGHEPETTRLFFDLAAKSSATIDVGAYVGYYSLLAGHANPAGRVLALEPLPPVSARLVRHLELNALDNVDAELVAAGRQPGSSSFYHGAHGLPTSSSLSWEFMSGASDVVASTVAVTTIDSLVRERGIQRVDLVKIDTESTEPDVLEGMREVLGRDRPNIFCEVLKGRGAESRLAPILEPYGYRFFLLTPDGPKRRQIIEGHSDWLNYLFVARSGVLP